MDSVISDQEFKLFRDLIYQIAGISLSDSKKVMVAGRLQRRLRQHNLPTFMRYYRMLENGQNSEEMQVMVDLLTTNETYFFREPAHFEFVRKELLPEAGKNGAFRVWSAASSSGEEAYTLAMTLAEYLPNAPWEVFGSDISTQVLGKARAAHYPLERIEGIPPAFLSKYCLKGVRSQAGTFMICPELRRHVTFAQVNLTQPIRRDIGYFDIIFLRNVMIYFDPETKRKVIANLIPQLKPGGHFIVGHSESLHGLTSALTQVRPTIYRKPV